MLTFSLKQNLAVEMKGRHLVLTGRYMNRKLAFKDEFGEPLVMTEKEFYSAYEKKDILVSEEQPLLGRVPSVRNAPPDLTCWPKAHAEEALRRAAYLDELLQEGNGVLPGNGKLMGLIQGIATRRGDAKPPSPSTVRRWARIYLRGKCTVRLVPAHTRKGRTHVLKGRVEDLLEETLETSFLRPERPTVSHLYDAFVLRVAEENTRLLPADQLKLPSEMTVRRYIDRLDPYLVDCARLGKYAADKKHRDATGKLLVKQILDRWEIDHTLLDVLVVDPVTGKVIGRPYITVVLDRRSRLVMSFLIHLAAPNTESVLRVIERAIRPKDAWLEKHPQVENDWPARGMPLVIVPDNAAEFHASDLVLAFDELGIEILYPRSRGPQMKGAVERFFRTLAVALIHCLRGTTFSNSRERGDYPAEERACLTLQELEALVMQWIVDVYHQKPHRGLYGKTPAEVWRAGETERTPRLPNDLDALEAVLGLRHSAPVHHYGIELDGQQYHSPELGELGRRLGPKARVDVRYRDDLGYLWVRDPFRNTFLQIPNKDKEMVGMSRDIYNAARARVREEKGDASDQRRVRIAYASIMAEAEAARKSNKMRQRRFAAKTKTDPDGQPRSSQSTEVATPSPVPTPTYEPPRELPAMSIRPRSI